MKNKYVACAIGAVVFLSGCSSKSAEWSHLPANKVNIETHTTLDIASHQAQGYKLEDVISIVN